MGVEAFLVEEVKLEVEVTFLVEVEESAEEVTSPEVEVGKVAVQEVKIKLVEWVNWDLNCLKIVFDLCSSRKYLKKRDC